MEADLNRICFLFYALLSEKMLNFKNSGCFFELHMVLYTSVKKLDNLVLE